MSYVMSKPVLPYANNKGADQPAHPRSLISAFVVRCLDSIIHLVSISEISSLYLPSVAEQVGLCVPWSQTLKTGILLMRLIYPQGIQDCWGYNKRMTPISHRKFPKYSDTQIICRNHSKI